MRVSVASDHDVIDCNTLEHDTVQKPVPTLWHHALARWLRHLGLVAACLCAASPLSAADRSVTIIEGVEEPPPQAEPPPPAIAALTEIKTDNPAGLNLAILPNGLLHIGTRVAFTVATQRPGYLVLVDINAAGTLTQIFPNMLSLSRTGGNVAAGNLITPGVPLTVPNLKNPLAHFVFTADLPRGSGAIVAILSDRPVQIIDLPETPDAPRAIQAAVDALQTSVSHLKIAAAGEDGKFAQGSWSFVAVSYRID